MKTPETVDSKETRLPGIFRLSSSLDSTRNRATMLAGSCRSIAEGIQQSLADLWHIGGLLELPPKLVASHLHLSRARSITSWWLENTCLFHRCKQWITMEDRKHQTRSPHLSLWLCRSSSISSSSVSCRGLRMQGYSAQARYKSHHWHWNHRQIRFKCKSIYMTIIYCNIAVFAHVTHNCKLWHLVMKSMIWPTCSSGNDSCSTSLRHHDTRLLHDADWM